MKNYGSIYKRVNGLYQGTVSVNGIRKTFYERNPSILQDIMNDFALNCMYSNVNKNNSVKFSVYALNYLFTYKYGVVKDTTFDRYESTVRCHVVNSSIDIPLYLLDDGIIQKYLISLSDNLSQSSINKVFDVLRAVLSYAFKRKDIDIDLSAFLVLPRSKLVTKKIDIYTSEEINILIRTIESGIISTDYRFKRRYRVAPGFLVLYYSGMRAGELLALKKCDIDFDKKLIHVNKTLSHIKARDSDVLTVYDDVISEPKTANSIRDVPISDNCRKYILWLLSDDIDSDYVIHNSFGGFMKLRSFQQTFRRICEEDAHINYKGLHALRHTFTSDLVRKGANVSIVSKILGHSSVKFTYDRYFHSPREDDFDTINLL
ncbi:MAG: tyrosine-type recombinase/integrase [Lachnospiraceae bacterium]